MFSVKDGRSLGQDSNGGDTMAVQAVQHGGMKSQFCQLYAGTVNGSPLATRTIQRPTKSGNCRSPSKSDDDINAGGSLDKDLGAWIQ